MGKAREFWITDNGGSLFERTISQFPRTANDIHVIERSAYIELKAKLAIAVNALEFYSGCRPDDIIANVALERIMDMK